MTKSRLIAVVLNLFFYGLGYLYLGRKRTLGLVLLLGNLAFIAAFVFGLVFHLPQATETYVSINGIGFYLIGAALGYDAYQLHKEQFPTATFGKNERRVLSAVISLFLAAPVASNVQLALSSAGRNSITTVQLGGAVFILTLMLSYGLIRVRIR